MAATYLEQIKCIERELVYRRRVYARQVSQGHLTQSKADYEIATMQAVLETLKQAAKNEPILGG